MRNGIIRKCNIEYSKHFIEFMETKFIFLKLLIVSAMIILKITMSSSTCGSSPNNGTGMACDAIIQSYAYLKTSMPPDPVVIPWGNYQFNQQYCVPFSLANGSDVTWVDAMSNGWNFWVNVADPDGCSSPFNFNQKMCGSPVMQSNIGGYTISYPGSFYASSELLKVPIASNRAMRFIVTATTNCNQCICNSCPPYESYGTYGSYTAWKFSTYKDYDAGAVSYILSSFDPTFTAGTLEPLNSIYYGCDNSDLQCP